MDKNFVCKLKATDEVIREFDDWEELGNYVNYNSDIHDVYATDNYNYPELFNSLFNGNNFDEVVEFLDDLSDEDIDKVEYLVLERSYNDLDDVMGKYDDVIIYYGDVEDYARECIDEGCMGEISDNLKYYLDYEAIARDMEWNGDIYDMGGKVITNHYEF